MRCAGAGGRRPDDSGTAQHHAPAAPAGAGRKLRAQDRQAIAGCHASASGARLPQGLRTGAARRCAPDRAGQGSAAVLSVNETVSCLPPSLAPLALCERERLMRYELPERGAPGHTPFALLPQSEAEVGLILRTATAARLPLVIAAGRTGLVEAQRPEGEAVLSLERLNRALALELADGRRCELEAGADAGAVLQWLREQGSPALSGARLVVQAGIAIDAVNALLEPLGLCWPLEMGSSSAASAGACVANASAGANALCYGTAAHMCDCAWGFWADGSAAGPDAGPRWRLPSAATLAIDSTRVDPDLGLVGSQGLFG